MPNLEACQEIPFGLYYMSSELNEAFELFYKNTNQVQTYFHQAWSIVADRLKDTPGILGYDILNEPWPGNLIRNPSLALNLTVAEFENLQPMYQRAHKSIRSKDNNTLLFYSNLNSDYFY